jgi:lysine 6-dehydrogenase
MDSTSRFECLVGGLPAVRHWPFEYKAPFSPADVLEEYTRPARLRKNGKTVTLPALSELETVDFEEAGSTGGLQHRWAQDPPQDLRDSGDDREDSPLPRARGVDEEVSGTRASSTRAPMQIRECSLSPREVTARLLEKMWTFEEGEEDLTVMRIKVDGVMGGKKERHTFFLLDRYDRETGNSSMARTTGFTCTAMVRLVARKLYARSPESRPWSWWVATPRSFDFVMKELDARGVVFRHQVEEIEGMRTTEEARWGTLLLAGAATLGPWRRLPSLRHLLPFPGGPLGTR